MMRVWLVNHYAYTPSDGASTRHWSLAHALIEMGHDVTIVASDFYHKGRQARAARSSGPFRREDVAGVPYVWVRTPPYEGNGPRRFWNMVVFALRTVSLGRRGAEVGLAAPDVVIGSSPDLLAAWAAERVARRHGAGLVVEVRDLWPETFVTLGGMSRRHPLVLSFGWVEAHLYRAADGVVSLLPGATDHIVERGAKPSAITWIPNGVDLDLVPTPAPAPDGDPFTVVYAGAHGMANGLDCLLDAARLLLEEGGSSIRIRLIGDGPEKNRLRRRVVSEGLTNVELGAPVPKVRVYAELAAADAFAIPLRDSSLYVAGFSQNKLWDYMASGRPVIASGGGSYSPVREAEAGIEVAPGSAADLAAAMRTLAATPLAARSAMGARGRAYVEEHHDVRRLARRYEGVLEDARGTAQPRRRRRGR